MFRLTDPTSIIVNINRQIQTEPCGAVFDTI